MVKFLRSKRVDVHNLIVIFRICVLNVVLFLVSVMDTNMELEGIRDLRFS